MFQESIPRKKRETKKLAYIGFTFENVEGIWFNPKVIKNLIITNIKENISLFDGFNYLTTFRIAEKISFSISREDLLDVSKQNLEEMHLKELTNQNEIKEHLDLIMNHFVYFNDIVSIDFYYKGDSFYESILTPWNPIDDYVNKNVEITFQNEVFHFEIKEEEENEYAKEN